MSEDTVPLSRGAAAHRITRQPPEPGSCLAHAGPGPGWGGSGGGEHSRAALTQGEPDLLSLPALEAPAERLWGEWAGAGAKGPERQMSPISVLPWPA